MDKCIKVSIPTKEGWRDCLFMANDSGTYSPAGDEYKEISGCLLLWYEGVKDTVEDDNCIPYQVIAQYGDEFPV